MAVATATGTDRDKKCTTLDSILFDALLPRCIGQKIEISFRHATGGSSVPPIKILLNCALSCRKHFASFCTSLRDYFETLSVLSRPQFLDLDIGGGKRGITTTTLP